MCGKLYHPITPFAALQTIVCDGLKLEQLPKYGEQYINCTWAADSDEWLQIKREMSQGRRRALINVTGQ